MIPKLIIFDFDGTLADTTADTISVYQQTIKALAAEPRSDAECQATIGIPLKEGFRQLYPDYSESELDNCVTTYRKIYNADLDKFSPQLYPGVMESIDKLHSLGIKMSVASSRSRHSLVVFCEKTGLSNYMSLIIGAEDVTHAKPDPEPVLMTLQQLNQDACETIVVGDMPVDIAMGKGAGCMTVGVTYGNSYREPLENADATHIIDSFPQLIDIVTSVK